MACLGYEETELRLGLLGGNNDAEEAAARSSGKRAFEETIDLKLKLEQPAPTGVLSTDDQKDHDDEEEAAVAEEVVVHGATAPLSSPAASVATTGGGNMKRSPSQSSVSTAALPDPEKPRAPKAQAVGWPPVRSFRKNIIVSVHSSQNKKGDKAEDDGGKNKSAALVKVSVDGAPYLRKVDLRTYGSYRELSEALEKMFGSFSIGSFGSSHQPGMKEEGMMNESRLADLLSGSEYVPTYEDKDGDWMLVGDVPWEMFVESCKRLRIMKGSEAVGLAPRAIEKRRDTC